MTGKEDVLSKKWFKWRVGLSAPTHNVASSSVAKLVIDETMVYILWLMKQWCIYIILISLKEWSSVPMFIDKWRVIRKLPSLLIRSSLGLNFGNTRTSRMFSGIDFDLHVAFHGHGLVVGCLCPCLMLIEERCRTKKVWLASPQLNNWETLYWEDSRAPS